MLESALKVSDMVEYCQHHHVPAMALCDHNNMFAMAEFSQSCIKKAVQPIAGLTLDIALNAEGNHFAPLCLFAKDEKGYRQLSRLSTHYYLNGHKPITLDELCDAHEGLIVLSGGQNGFLNNQLQYDADKALQAVETLKSVFNDRFYIELTRHSDPLEKKIEAKLLDIAGQFKLPLIATNHCYYPNKNHHAGWQILRGIGTGENYHSDGATEYGEHYLKSPDEMKALFEDLPEAIENTVHLAQRCSFLLQTQPILLPKYHDLGDETEEELLTRLSQKGFENRLKKHVFPRFDKREHDAIRTQYQQRLSFELEIILSRGFASYFLIVDDFIRWAKQNDIPVGPGRGSGAGSLVAWVLEITDLDPIRWALLFERFLNPERVSMPDFDVDFCQDRRGEVINYVRDIYGADCVGQIITFGTLKPRACVRDVGRVMGLPYSVADRISKLIPDFTSEIAPLLSDGKQGVAALRESYQQDNQIKTLLNFTKQLEGLYRHASTHAAGVVIANRPLVEIVPLYHDGSGDSLPATQFSMKYVESTGLVKFDFLGLRTLTVIHKAVAMVQQNHDVKIDISTIKLDEKKAYAMLATGDSMGVFQLESSGMRDVLRNMQPDRFEDLIAAVALYRPGPMENIPAYNARKNGKEKVVYLHPLLEKVLGETYGIPVYQEQVMQMAEVLAGYTLGTADKLRRAMGKKDLKEMAAERENFIKGAEEHHQIPQKQAELIFSEMEAFAGYGFNKSHAAAYALVAYQTAWLKVFYPLEYYAAMLTYEMQNTSKIANYKVLIEQQNITFLPPDINQSDVGFKADIENNALCYALAALKNAGEDVMIAIVAERNENGAYKSLIDFAERNCKLKIGRRALETMCKAGVFDSLVEHRAQSFEAISLMVAHSNACLAQQDSTQNNLFFDAQNSNPPAPELPEVEIWAHHDMLNYELEAVGFYITDHPLSPYKEAMKGLQVVEAKDIESHKGKINLCGIANQIRKIRTRTGKRMGFVTFSDMSGQFEIALFEEQLNDYQGLLEGQVPLLIKASINYQTDQQGQEKLRLRFMEMELLDTKISEKIHQLELSFDEEKWLKIIHNILEHHGQKGTGKIILKFPVEDKILTMGLEENYHLSPGLLKAFRSSHGIEVITR